MKKLSSQEEFLGTSRLDKKIISYFSPNIAFFCQQIVIHVEYNLQKREAKKFLKLRSRQMFIVDSFKGLAKQPDKTKAVNVKKD